MSADTEQRKLAAIMFTDMVGYSALSQRNSIEILARVVAQMGEPERSIAALEKPCQCLAKVRLLKTGRSLPRCFGSIQCSIRSVMIRASKNSSPPQRRKKWFPNSART
jgi:hypothetical protein